MVSIMQDTEAAEARNSVIRVESGRRSSRHFSARRGSRGGSFMAEDHPEGEEEEEEGRGGRESSTETEQSGSAKGGSGRSRSSSLKSVSEGSQRRGSLFSGIRLRLRKWRREADGGGRRESKFGPNASGGFGASRPVYVLPPTRSLAALERLALPPPHPSLSTPTTSPSPPPLEESRRTPELGGGGGGPRSAARRGPPPPHRSLGGSGGNGGSTSDRPPQLPRPRASFVAGVARHTTPHESDQKEDSSSHTAEGRDRPHRASPPTTASSVSSARPASSASFASAGGGEAPRATVFTWPNAAVDIAMEGPPSPPSPPLLPPADGLDGASQDATLPLERVGGSGRAKPDVVPSPTTKKNTKNVQHNASKGSAGEKKKKKKKNLPALLPASSTWETEKAAHSLHSPTTAATASFTLPPLATPAVSPQDTEGGGPNGGKRQKRLLSREQRSRRPGSKKKKRASSAAEAISPAKGDEEATKKTKKEEEEVEEEETKEESDGDEKKQKTCSFLFPPPRSISHASSSRSTTTRQQNKKKSLETVPVAASCSSSPKKFTTTTRPSARLSHTATAPVIPGSPSYPPAVAGGRGGGRPTRSRVRPRPPPRVPSPILPPTCTGGDDSSGGVEGSHISTELVQQLVFSISEETADLVQLLSRATERSRLLLERLSSLQTTADGLLVDNVRLRHDKEALRVEMQQTLSRHRRLKDTAERCQAQDRFDNALLRSEQETVVEDLREALALKKVELAHVKEQMEVVSTQIRGQDALLLRVQHFWREHAIAMRNQCQSSHGSEEEEGEEEGRRKGAPKDVADTALPHQEEKKDKTGEDDTCPRTSTSPPPLQAHPSAEPATSSSTSLHSSRSSSSCKKITDAAEGEGKGRPADGRPPPLGGSGAKKSRGETPYHPMTPHRLTPTSSSTPPSHVSSSSSWNSSASSASRLMIPGAFSNAMRKELDDEFSKDMTPIHVLRLRRMDEIAEFIYSVFEAH